MARRRATREIEADLEAEVDAEAAPLPRSRRRIRRRHKLLLVLLLLVGLVIAAPTIVGSTPLRDVLLAKALPPSAAQLSGTGATFSWISGQTVTGLTLVDADGATVATVESASIDRSLVALFANSRHLGKIVLTQPVVRIETRGASSNLEELVRAIAVAAAQSELQTPQSTEGAPTTIAQVEVVEGTVYGRDAATGQEWRIDQLTATASPSEAREWQATAAGFLTLGAATGAPPGAPIDGAGRFKLAFHPGDKGAQQLDILADRLPLAPLEPWLARGVAGARVLGVASADLKLNWVSEAAAASWTAMGKVDAADVRFTADALAGDTLELATASLAVDATLAADKISARQFAARSEWFEAEGAGDFDLAQLAGASLQQLPRTDARLTARVDLPQLTRMMPRTVRLRQGVRIDSGTAEASLHSLVEDGVRRWKFAAAVENLLGADGERTIRWTEPVELGADVADSPAGPQLKQLIARSPFAELTVDGAEGGFEGQGRFDLAQLADQAGQFLDLSAWQLRGTGEGSFSWRDAGADQFAASALVDLANIDVRRSGQTVWVDPEVHLELQAAGTRANSRPVELRTGSALVRGPRDTLAVELLEPVELASAEPTWFVSVKGDGPLDSWAGRARPWAPTVPDELAGQTTLSCRLRLSASLVELTQSQLSIRDFRTRVAGAEILEPRIEASGDLSWNAAARALTSQDLTLASSTVAGRARGVQIELSETGSPIVRGDIAFRGDLERIAAWAGRVGVDGALWPRGQAEGRMQLASDGSGASATIAMKSTPFTLVRSDGAGAPPAIAWNEPALQFAADAVYTQAEDRLQLTNLRLDGQTVTLTGGGEIAEVRTAGLVRGDVTVNYDSAELGKLLATYLGPGVRITGGNSAHVVAQGRLHTTDPLAPSPSRGGSTEHGQPEVARAQVVPQTQPSGRGEEAGTPVAIQSVSTSRLQPPASSLPHWSRRWQLSAETAWSAADLYGLPVGQAAVTASIRDGQIQFQPLDVAVGQGRLTAQPRALLDPPPRVLQLAAGPLVSNVAVSAEVSDAMLKYAAPILANATRISGTFSLTTEGVTVPLGEPNKMSAQGQLRMHQLSVLPGPGLEDIVGIIQRLQQAARARPEDLLGAIVQQPATPTSGITMQEQTIDVQVVDGRVYHRNLKFMVDDVPVTSYGSVGFDQTLALVITVPVQEKWVRGTPALHGLIGRPIEIPVHGTMTQWNVDEKAVTAFLAQAAQTAVSGAVGGELNKLFDGLFRKQ
jgi:translocation and assembly module TamB